MVRKPSVYPPSAIKDILPGKPGAKGQYVGYEARFAEWATSQGWDVTKRGWPDFICRRDGALMAVEVKGGKDNLSPEQVDALDDLSALGLPTYVYFDGLGLKRWRGRKVESVATLKEEISELHHLIRKVVQVREEMVPSIVKPPHPDEWTMQYELDLVIKWCRETHGDNDVRPGSRMTVCAWVHFLRKYQRQEWDAIVEMTGEGFPQQVKGLHRKIVRVIARAKAQYGMPKAA